MIKIILFLFISILFLKKKEYFNINIDNQLKSIGYFLNKTGTYENTINNKDLSNLILSE